MPVNCCKTDKTVPIITIGNSDLVNTETFSDLVSFSIDSLISLNSLLATSSP